VSAGSYYEKQTRKKSAEIFEFFLPFQRFSFVPSENPLRFLFLAFSNVYKRKRADVAAGPIGEVDG
jgi:hypothetical protein